MDMFEKRRVDIGYVQEGRYRGQGTRGYRGEEKYNFWCSGSEEGRNGVGIMVKKDLVEEVIEGKRLHDCRMIKIAMMCGRKVHVFSVYTPQWGRRDEEKGEFLEDYQISLEVKGSYKEKNV